MQPENPPAPDMLLQLIHPGDLVVYGTQGALTIGRVKRIVPRYKYNGEEMQPPGIVVKAEADTRSNADKRANEGRGTSRRIASNIALKVPPGYVSNKLNVF